MEGPVVVRERWSPSMAPKLSGARPPADFELDPALMRYLPLEARDGAVVSRRCADGCTAGLDSFPDLVGYEAFVNKIHVDDWLAGSASTRLQLRNALALAASVATSAIPRLADAILVYVSIDGESVVFRFVADRPEQASWLGDPREFEEPLLEQRWGPPGGVTPPSRPAAGRARGRA